MTGSARATSRIRRSRTVTHHLIEDNDPAIRQVTSFFTAQGGSQQRNRRSGALSRSPPPGTTPPEALPLVLPKHVCFHRSGRPGSAGLTRLAPPIAPDGAP